jgi:hypothetical protein
MAQADIPQHVRDLIRRHIDSIQQVEILRLLGSQPERAWAAAEVCRALHIGERLCAGWLAEFATVGLVNETTQGYRRAAPNSEAHVADELVECYARRRMDVIEAIYNKDAAV